MDIQHFQVNAAACPDIYLRWVVEQEHENTRTTTQQDSTKWQSIEQSAVPSKAYQAFFYAFDSISTKLTDSLRENSNSWMYPAYMQHYLPCESTQDISRTI